MGDDTSLPQAGKELNARPACCPGKETAMFENSLWLLIVAGGPLLLAILLAWALLTRRRAGPAERRERDRATRETYRDAH
jgi:hypothetical protein